MIRTKSFETTLTTGRSLGALAREMENFISDNNITDIVSCSHFENHDNKNFPRYSILLVYNVKEEQNNG